MGRGGNFSTSLAANIVAPAFRAFLRNRPGGVKMENLRKGGLFRLLLLAGTLPNPEYICQSLTT